MIEEIRSGISLALSGAFPDCPVYGDQLVDQGLEPPCFFVGVEAWTVSPLPCRMRRARLPVDVVYFPLTEGCYSELWAVGAQVLDLLGELNLPGGGSVRGTDLHCAVADGLMHVHALYTLRLMPGEMEGQVMEEMTLHTGSCGAR